TMATKLNTMKIPAWVPLKSGRALAAPILILMMLAMMVLPLPAFMLDLLFSFNLSLSVIVLMTALYTVKPLDFIAFP
ncbi:FHIPEP family type III secretion protein, partial [Acinetobacter baumannii]